ncbi:hypothetical protein F5883DRAFT_537156 [Diaporthe sp. PMI_573]|nr:hypothetical protein F5883DRAFT_537156 [Diaporthaceae sp. PMI_573]
MHGVMWMRVVLYWGGATNSDVRLFCSGCSAWACLRAVAASEYLPLTAFSFVFLRLLSGGVAAPDVPSSDVCCCHW